MVVDDVGILQCDWFLTMKLKLSVIQIEASSDCFIAHYFVETTTRIWVERQTENVEIQIGNR